MFFKWFIFSRIKKDERQGKEKCHAKSMMSNEANEKLNIDTQHVPLRHSFHFFFCDFEQESRALDKLQVGSIRKAWVCFKFFFSNRRI